MKNVVLAFMIMFVGGLLLANAPPGADQIVTIDDVTIEMTIEQPAGIILAPEILTLETVYLGGVVLQVDEVTWSATTTNIHNVNPGYDNHQVELRTARDGLSYSSGQITTTTEWTKRSATNLLASVNQLPGLFRLDIGELIKEVAYS